MCCLISMKLIIKNINLKIHYSIIITNKYIQSKLKISWINGTRTYKWI